MAATTVGRKVKFGIFEADLFARRLWKRGSPVHLQEKPFLLLSLLLDRRGEIVTRDELRDQLWSRDTFVEFDEGVNAAVGKVRFALGDSADNPVFFETVRGKGYRWIAPVEVLASTDDRPETHDSRVERPGEVSSNSSVSTPRQTTSSWIGWIALTVAAATILFVLLSYLSKRTNVAVQPASIKQWQLTTNSSENPVSSNAISPDGRYLAYADLKGLHIELTTTGEVRDVPNPAPYDHDYVYWGISGWLPDGTGSSRTPTRRTSRQAPGSCRCWAVCYERSRTVGRHGPSLWTDALRIPPAPVGTETGKFG